MDPPGGKGTIHLLGRLGQVLDRVGDRPPAVGLRRGDVIQQVAGRAVATPAEVEAAVAEGRRAGEDRLGEAVSAHALREVAGPGLHARQEARLLLLGTVVQQQFGWAQRVGHGDRGSECGR